MTGDHVSDGTAYPRGAPILGSTLCRWIVDASTGPLTEGHATLDERATRKPRDEGASVG